MTGPVPGTGRGSGIGSPRTAVGRRLRGPISATRFAVIVALANALIYHVPLFSWAAANLDMASANGVLTLAIVFVMIVALTATLLLLLFALAAPLVRPACVLLALGNSIALYFIATYRVILDQSMMSNVLTTDAAETAELLHPSLLLYVACFGLLPAAWIVAVRLQRVARLRLLLQAVVAVLACGVLAYLNSGTWLWIDKNSKRLGGMIVPWSYVINLPRAKIAAMGARDQVLLPPATFGPGGKRLVVLVIGEAARAQNFSLYGYPRNTNPRLTAAGVVAMKNTVSCSTYTTASLRCILSHTGATSLFARQFEPLPSYLQRHGVDVIWRTNNWGEPALEVGTYERAEDLRNECAGPDCAYDGALLTGLGERIASSERSRVFVVLHQKGSHGPSYSTRYPPAFERFAPVCRSVELHQCGDEELVNAYDNTILYTDQFLARVIELLAGLERTPAVLMYISDHGESLGEFGLYLHGTPISLAPDVQKRIPFLVWANRAAGPLGRLNRRDGYSQRNVFHSVMGAFDMHSEIYDPSLDVFAEAAGGQTADG